MSGKFKFAIDRGGTFTDVYAICPDGKERVTKLLSVDPSNYPDAPREGIRRILEEVYLIQYTNWLVFKSILLMLLSFCLFLLNRSWESKCLLANQWIPQ